MERVMREIKFRGKGIDNGEWIYGDLLQYRVLPVIFDKELEQHEVDAETIGQFTGLRDGNGDEIYEGDIISRPVNPTEWNKKHFGITKKKMEKAEIRWDRDNACFEEQFHPGKTMHPCFDVLRLVDAQDEVSIIGNIYENPELMEV